MKEHIEQGVPGKTGALPFRFDFSIIVPCFNEDLSIQEFHERLIQTLLKMNRRFEVIYVNDGSTDSTLTLLREIYEDGRLPVSVVDLIQNVGQTNAWTAGLQYAAGRDIIFLDCDLQVAPEDLPLLLDVYDDSYDMVGGARTHRKDSLFRVHYSKLGNAFIRRVLGLPLYDFGSGVKILNGDFVRAFDPGPLRPINPGAMMLSLRRVAEVPIPHYARRSGRSRWTVRRFFALYHNIFRHLVPFAYPFTVAPLLVLSFLALVYFGLSTFFPNVFPYMASPAVLPTLIMLNITLSLVHFLLLGEFVLRGSSHAQETAYIVRHVFLARLSDNRNES